MPAHIEFSPELIPETKEKMPVLQLGPPSPAPRELVLRYARAVAPEANFTTLGNAGLQAAHHGDQLISYIHPVTGESRVFPLLEKLNPGQGLAARANALAAKMAGDESLFPKDGTRVVALPAVTLVGAKHLKDKGRGKAEEYLAFVRFQRQVNGMPVWGAGTRAMIAVDAVGTIRGFAHRWRSATINGKYITPAPREELAEKIVAQLERTAPNASGTVRVNKVTTGYYDGGGALLQPVYRFEAVLVPPAQHDGKRTVAASNVFGYVPVGAPVEALPELGVLNGKPPAYAPKKHSAMPETVAAAGDPTIGRYVVRDDSPDWVNSANNFLGSLREANFFGSPIPFTDSQYYWAEPFEYESNKDSFINSVNIALTESHGNWGLFTTEKNNADFVYLNSIPSSGYGGPGTSLSYWIIHSCEVIPTQTDESTSFDVWWNIFQGIHAVAGYRTEMWINDGATSPFGFSIGFGAPVVSAWLNAVASDDAYDDGATYLDGNRNITEPMGRASAIAVCGHGDDTVNDLGSLGPASCLTEWWFNN